MLLRLAPLHLPILAQASNNNPPARRPGCLTTYYTHETRIFTTYLLHYFDHESVVEYLEDELDDIGDIEGLAGYAFWQVLDGTLRQCVKRCDYTWGGEGYRSRMSTVLRCWVWVWEG